MPANSKQNTPDKDEIDLMDLFSRLGEFIKKAFLGLINIIGFVLVFLLRKWYYFACAVLLTIGTAYLLNKTVKGYYHSDLIMRSNVTTNQTIMSSLDKLGGYASDRNYAALSSELQLSREDANKIKGLETFWLYDIDGDGIYDGVDIDRHYLSDTSVIKINDEFVIRIDIFDPAIVDIIEESLVNYLESRPYLIVLNDQRLIELEERLNQTQYEIEKLDSLQKREYYTNPDYLRQKDSQIVFTSEENVQTYHDDMLRLLTIRQQYEKDLNVYSDIVTVIEGFSIPNNPDNGYIDYGKRLIWGYLLLALLIAVLVTLRKKIWIKSKS